MPKLIKYMRERFWDADPSSEQDLLSIWRKRIFYAVFLTTAIISTFPYTVSMISAIKSKWWTGIIVFVLYYLLLIGVILIRCIPFKIRAWAGASFFYLFGLFMLLTIGIIGSGRIYLFSFSTIACLLLGFRAGLITVVLNFITMITIGLLASADYLNWAVKAPHAIEIWHNITTTFLWLNTIIIVSISVLIHNLELGLKKEQKLTKTVQKSEAQYRLLAETLEENEQKLKTILDSVQTGIVIVNAETDEIIDVNPAASEIIEAPKEQIIGHIHHDYIYHTEKEKCPITGIEQKLDNSERTLLTANGEKRSILKTVSQITLNKQKCFLNSFIDITEKKRLETQLQQSQKMEAMGTLAGGIAHDFNNILFPIIGYTEMLILEAPENSAIRKDLDIILSGAMRAKDLVQQILTFSRQQKQELTPLMIQIVINEALKLFKVALPPTIEIIQSIDKKCGLVMADFTQIHQIIMNLCTNAYHAMEKTGGKLKVSLAEIELKPNNAAALKPGKYAMIIVSDTGCGMEQKVMKRIFESHFTTKENGKGTGLGLSVVYDIIDRYNGKITVRSEPMKGSIFNIYLPLIDTQKKKIKTINSELERGNGERILLVDDEALIVSMGKEMLKRFGYHVTSFTNSVEALKMFQAQPNSFDVIITDKIMPDMTGYKLASEIIKIRKDIPIISCSGFSDKMSNQELNDLGIKATLMKPVTMKQLAETVRDVLDEN